MRKLAILLLLVAPVLAEDDAASLFYKGFWLEQAEGKLDEAAALYGKLLSERPDAPEAPRALLGLIRIKVARNEDPKELAAELERRYPAAKEELADAQRFAVARTSAFDPRKGAESAVGRKLVELYERKLRDLDAPEEMFLIDLGSAAHPMLAALLRDQDADAVGTATYILMKQNTPEAHAALARALLDEEALFRSMIVERFNWCPGDAPVLVEALERLYDRAQQRLRNRILVFLPLLTSGGGKGTERAVALLARALGDKDARGEAAAAIGKLDSSFVSDACLDALLRLAEARDPSLADRVYGCLVAFADRPAFRDRIEKVLAGRPLESWMAPHHEEGALLLARLATNELRGGNRGVYAVAEQAAAASPRAAATLLLCALELDYADLTTFVKRGIGNRDPAKYLGEEAKSLRVAALAAAADVAESQGAAVGKVLGIVGLGADDFPAIVEAMRRRGDKGLPGFLLDGKRLEALGPGKAGALVDFCRDEEQVGELLAEGGGFLKGDDRGVEFYRQVIPKAGPGLVRLDVLWKSPQIAPLVARRLLEAKGPEWKWVMEPAAGRSWDRNLNAEQEPGPFLARRIGFLQESLRTEVLAHVEDSRLDIAVPAAQVAAADTSPEATKALERALGSRWADARSIALQALARRVPDGAGLVREHARRADLDAPDRRAVERVIVSGKHAAVAGELLRQGGDEWALLWGAYHALSPKECIDLALTSALAGEDKHRAGAVYVLTLSEDPRRIGVFRQVLRDGDKDQVVTVLRALGSQYLVELGSEVLDQMRSPDYEVREAATNALQQLKFYAEAKKAFEK